MLKHGYSIKGKVKPIYIIWCGIKYRCINPKGKNNIKYYKDKNITYDPKWETFQGFLDDMLFPYLYAIKQLKMKRPSIERKDNNKGYYKDNCTFIEKNEQAKNRTNMKWFIAISPKGKKYIKKNRAEFAKKIKISPTGIYKCLNKIIQYCNGWRFKSIGDKNYG